MRGDKFKEYWGYLRETLTEYMTRKKEETYIEHLTEGLAKSKRDHVTIYKEAGMDRRYYSKLICGKMRLPSKSAMIRLGLAMHLDYEGMQRLLHSCGYHLSNSVDLDLVIMYCIHQGQYDLFKINELLYDLGFPLLE